MITFRERHRRALQARLCGFTPTRTGSEAERQPVRLRQRRLYPDHENRCAEAGADRRQIRCAIGGARRDEERSRAKERVFSVRGPGHSWDPKRQRPELWHLYNGQLAPDETLRVFPLSNWTELDVWTYILFEGIDVVPLYFAAMRPTVERDGALIVVDDDRMRFRPGETPVPRMVRFRSLGCYPLSAAVLSTAATIEDIVTEMQQHPHLRTRRPADRFRPGFLDGKEEARGIFLMPDSLLRVLTCGSVDDGKSTLIGRLLFECGSIPDDVMARPGARQPPLRHGRKRCRLRAAGRWPGSRARAGRHHRRRLPLFRNAAAALHPGRYARAPAIHPQHGHRRLHRGSCRSAGGRTQRPAGADPSTRRDRHHARHPPGSCWPSTRWTWSASISPPSTPSSPRSKHCKTGSGRCGSPPSRSVRAMATTSPPRAPACRGTPAPRFCARSKQQSRMSPRHAPGRSACRCSSSPAPTIRSAAMPERSAAAPCASAAPSPIPCRGPRHASPVSSPWTATWRMRLPGQAVTLVLDREIDVSRGDVLGAHAAAGNRRPDQRPRGLDGRNAAVPRPRLSAAARHHPGGCDRHRNRQPAGYRHAHPKSRCANCT